MQPIQSIASSHGETAVIRELCWELNNGVEPTPVKEPKELIIKSAKAFNKKSLNGIEANNEAQAETNFPFKGSDHYSKPVNSNIVPNDLVRLQKRRAADSPPRFANPTSV